MNFHASYRLEVRCMECGNWFAQLVDRDTDREVWESREYDEMDEAYAAGKYEWEVRAEQAREEHAIRIEALKQELGRGSKD